MTKVNNEIRTRRFEVGLLALLAFLALRPSAPAEDGPAVYNLDLCVRQALKTNRDVLVQRVEQTKAGYRIREAWAGAFPQLGFEGTFNRNFKRPSFFFNASGGFGGEGDSSSSGGDGGTSETVKIEIGSKYDYNAAFSLTQPLWLAGKVGAALKAAELYDRSADRQVASREQDVVLQTTAAFYGALLAKREVNVFEEALAQAEKSLVTTKDRRDRGLASDFEVLRAEVAVSEAKPALIGARNRERQTLNDLKLVLGVDVGSPIEVRGGFEFTPLPEEVVDARRETAVDRRPERQTAELQVKLLEQNARVVRSDLFPNFYLTGNYVFSGSSNEWDRFGEMERSRSAAAGVYVSFPFWTSGATTARLRQARADLRISRIRLEQTEESIRKEVAAAELDLAAAAEQTAAAAMAARQGEMAYGIAETRYENGLMTQIELLDARLVRTRTRVNHLRALHDALIAEAAWKRVVGVGGEEERR
ncbi:MAG: TolC family protein [Candidatus Eisenbacteria bacterium]